VGGQFSLVPRLNWPPIRHEAKIAERVMDGDEETQQSEGDSGLGKRNWERNFTPVRLEAKITKRIMRRSIALSTIKRRRGGIPWQSSKHCIACELKCRKSLMRRHKEGC
jgi:hypothetical protein